ncbi:hypothetical protein BC835DRAFT_1368067 [Cytidiella melzeri]|nr:hypothetical protein BC835DRAFT_1368067 [Cytidiella melzeri]
MRLFTSIVFLTAMVTGAVYTVTVSAVPYSSPATHLAAYPDNKLASRSTDSDPEHDIANLTGLTNYKFKTTLNLEQVKKSTDTLRKAFGERGPGYDALWHEVREQAEGGIPRDSLKSTNPLAPHMWDVYQSIKSHFLLTGDVKRLQKLTEGGHVYRWWNFKVNRCCGLQPITYPDVLNGFFPKGVVNVWERKKSWLERARSFLHI